MRKKMREESNKHRYFLAEVKKTLLFLRTSGGMQQLIIFLYNSQAENKRTSVTRMWLVSQAMQ